LCVMGGAREGNVVAPSGVFPARGTGGVRAFAYVVKPVSLGPFRGAEGPPTLGACSCIIHHTLRCGIDLMVFALCERGWRCTQTLLKHIIPN